MMNAFQLSYEALMCSAVDKKIKLTEQLYCAMQTDKLCYKKEYAIRPVQIPGRPNRPNLVRFQSLPKRNNSDKGMISTIHAICHIEFNAINLALDAIYRFQKMPEQYYQDWIKVAFEEAKHFRLINQYLIDLGYHYGHFDAHNGLWKMTTETDYDVLARMALIPRVLEAKGLDATPAIQKKFEQSKFHKMATILEVIFQDEIGHVKIGNYWYHYLCKSRNLDPVQTFDALIKKHIGKKPRGPFNFAARALSNFSKAELEYLKAN